MIEKAYASIAEGQVHLRRSGGDAAGVPLVMLHASPASSQTLEPLMKAIGPGHPLMAFDTPGNGQSCAPLTDEPGIADFANMLDRSCDALKLDKILLYGTHTGAHIAIEWALARPDRVAGLVLDGVALLSEEQRAEFLENYAPPQVPDPTGAQFHWAWHYIRDQMIFFPHYRRDAEYLRTGGTFDPLILHRLTLDVLNNLGTYHMPYRAVFRHEVRKSLRQLQLPIQVLVEGTGPLDAGNAELEKLLPEASIAKGCAEPEDKARAIKAFMEGIEG